MTDFEKLLNDVINGKGNLAPVRAWLDKNLSKPGCDHGELMGMLDKALAAGLSEPVARAIRTHNETVAPPPTPPAAPAGADFPFELEEMAPGKDDPAGRAAEKTQIGRASCRERV